MNEGLLCKSEHKFNTSFSNDDDGEGLRLGMVWEGPATPSAGAQGHRGWGSKQQPSSLSPTGAALALPYLRRRLQNLSQEVSQNVLVPGGVTGSQKASARV